MMHIIGTAGHVDHGKTALIEVLTGINADRLPEEKKRGMTIDLGFAHFTDTNNTPVGVIDVPGHERFIRNMVAGAWSLSCALLVIAADEGWMQQTEDHARVLQAMEIQEVVCVLTKTDLVDTNALQSVSEGVAARLIQIFQREIPIKAVSSHSKDGIDSLRQYILSLLDNIPEKETENGAYIHIDRSFTVKGSGTVITGSLAGGPLSEGDDILILPQNLKTRVRGIQSYHNSITTAYPVSRIACNIHGIKKEEVKRGSIAAVRSDDFWTDSEFVIQWSELDTENGIKNHMELEIAAGTGHYTGRIHFFRNKNFARIVLNREISVLHFDSCLFIRQGGHHILGKGRFIWPGQSTPAFRNRLLAILKQYPVPGTITNQDILGFLLDEYIISTSNRRIQAVVTFTRAHNIETELLGSSLIEKKRYDALLQKLITAAAKPGGISKARYIQSVKVPRETAEEIIHNAVQLTLLQKKDDLLLSLDQQTDENAVSPLADKILQMLKERDNKGLQLKELSFPGAKKELAGLVKNGRVLALEGEIYYSREKFNMLAGRILDGLNSGSTFSIPAAKQRTGLTRRYIIPLLNKMEEKGMVKRQGDVRLVL